MKEDNKIFWKFIKSKTKAKESIPCILDDEGGIMICSLVCFLHKLFLIHLQIFATDY
jgi:hypothetical protein